MTENKMRFVDLHCDTIVCEVMQSRGEKHLRSNPSGHLDLERLKKAGSLVQAFALFIDKHPSREGYFDDAAGPWAFFNAAADWFDREMADNTDLVAPVHEYADIEKNAAKGLISALLTVEDGVPLEGDIKRLDEMYRRGVRLITITWNNENSLGFPNETSPEKGLKPFGIEALARMNELGIIADCSHLSDAGFWDIVKFTKKPFVASHSNAKAVCPIYRNLTDGMLRALASKGGVTGLNFCPSFLAENSRKAFIKDIVRHARHIADVAGAETLALGSDFDGIGGWLEFTDCAGLPMIEDGLHTAFTAREVDMITHENALRVFRDNMVR